MTITLQSCDHCEFVHVSGTKLKKNGCKRTELLVCTYKETAQYAVHEGLV